MRLSIRPRSPTIRFLIGGGTAALVNWLVRIPLSLILPFGLAVLAAQAVGLAVGFVIYRNYVFEGHGGRIRQQLPVFLGVNVVGALVVWTVSIGVLFLLSPLGLVPTASEATAHAVGIASGAVANYVGHRHLTFPRNEAPRVIARLARNRQAG